MTITYYGYPKCTTCRKAKKWLSDQSIDFNEVNLVENPPSAKTIQEMIQASNLDMKNFFNTRGRVYREEKLKDKLPDMTDEEKIALLSSNGMLIKRPIVFGNNRITIGFNEEEFTKTWG